MPQMPGSHLHRMPLLPPFFPALGFLSWLLLTLPDWLNAICSSPPSLYGMASSISPSTQVWVYSLVWHLMQGRGTTKRSSCSFWRTRVSWSTMLEEVFIRRSRRKDGYGYPSLSNHISCMRLWDVSSSPWDWIWGRRFYVYFLFWWDLFDDVTYLFQHGVCFRFFFCFTLRQ